jgi:hypothetical protein
MTKITFNYPLKILLSPKWRIALSFYFHDLFGRFQFAYMNTLHSFHIPVMGLGYTVDSPIKVARFGISSAVSIMDDHLLEEMRRIYSRKNMTPYHYIDVKEEDYRAKRITAYLDFLDDTVKAQVAYMKSQPFGVGADIDRYFELLPYENPLFNLYHELLRASGSRRLALEDSLRKAIVPGAIDVNIMTKVDKINSDKEGNELPREYSDALSALRGFAMSKVEGSVVFSAGLNPALYSYAAQFPGFFPDEFGKITKKIILKVSDYRSALIQGKFLAKKGLWISEFRIESGLNCGGHAFATEGFLAGPILEEFKSKKADLTQALLSACQQYLTEIGGNLLPAEIQPKITYQGGLGTAAENRFLTEYYQFDGTGWGSPFLLVPEATSVDKDTLDRLIQAKKSDFYLSHASPLGVPFNNLRTSSAEQQRLDRIEKKRPGSPCYKKFLAFSKEFSEKSICTASREYQNLKIKLFEKKEISSEQLTDTLEKDCLCEGLSAPAILSLGETPKRNLKAVTICPGPNLAYFKGVFSLKEMVDHIYGKIQITLDASRPHVFIKELQLYVDHFQKEVAKALPEPTAKYEAYLSKFKGNLNAGIQYYNDLINQVSVDAEEVILQMKEQLKHLQQEIERFVPSVA